MLLIATLALILLLPNSSYISQAGKGKAADYAALGTLSTWRRRLFTLARSTMLWRRMRHLPWPTRACKRISTCGGSVGLLERFTIS
ncbi:hypothetical protein BJ875DRAFT_454250 [Amylocarpus encephaloides]|uniref:Uncharacterized protein n=1 Tax=Amylocarpus encephaloides TaxID=45428 RepID=A0A9P7YPD5_9HELO|nr:hypothetical protein BJ875DRAFT_454250 [Amylocarpus encephaloides]